MEKVSAVIIVFNEERNLAACLDTVSFADEIVVVDSHSTDRTIEIAGLYTDRIFQKEYRGHIDKKRYAVGLASNDWVFSIDADERVTPELGAEIEGALREPGDFAGFDMPRLTRHLGRWIRHGEWYPDHVTRLFRRSLMRYEGTEPHDIVVLDGRKGRFRSDLLHFNYRDLAHQLATVQSYSDVAAKAMFEQGRRAGLFTLLTRPAAKFLKSYVLRLGFLDGMAGLVIAVFSAFYAFAKYAKLWEMKLPPDPEKARAAGGKDDGKSV